MAEIPHEWVGMLKSLLLMSRVEPVEIKGVGRARLRRKGGKLVLYVEIDHQDNDIKEAVLNECS